MKLKAITSLVVGGCIMLAATNSYANDDNAVTIVLGEAPQVIEPCESAIYGVGIILKQNVTETLTELDPQSGVPVPRLATSWKQLNKNTWQFKLREGVKFHDGTPFNAQSVVYSLERMMDPGLKCMTRNKFFTPGTFAAKAVDDLTVDISADPGQQILPSLLSTLVIVSHSTPKGQATPKPVGTGPYAFESWRQGESVVLKRFDGYWGAKPVVEKATFLSRNESAVQAAMVTTGEADIAPSIAVQDATNPETDFSYPNSETSRIRIGQDKPPLSDVRVRKALNLAIDRNAFVGTILSKDVQPASQLVVPTTLGYDGTIKPWAYDPEQAKKLIAEAKASGVPVDAEIRLIGRQNLFPNVNEVLEAMTQMWEAVGLKVKLEMVERGQALQLGTKPYAADRRPTLITDQHNNNMGDASFTVVYKYSTSGPQSDTSDPALDALIAKAAASSGDERKALFQKSFQTIASEIVPDVMLFHMVGYARVNPRVHFKPSIATNSELQLATISFAD
ncbi:ABC transporter substrate-binding protein [Ensifer sp. SSB1]|uniref:ABC transporter substrate-binding protein n=1 Tax=Ensifer sp. SSB1 TaxID=2795385 RepID=UPI001A592E9D|nr:ABC transporter substrate-binding protein [Ensifer sp. SSB1]MBK5570623.1 peptide ABC transporter substrate-binding protein [Ensifer sp. SSB1]